MSIRRYEVLLVHGVGEQRRSEHLENTAANFLRAIREVDRGASAEVLHAETEPRHSAERGWRRVPVVLRWRKAGAQDQQMEVHFREIHWADLDMPMTLRRWLELVGWALSVSGVRIYSKGNRGLINHPGMRLPPQLPWLQTIRVRVELLLVSMLFFLMVLTLDVVYFVLQRFSFRAGMLRKARGIIYDYLGDVKLYQDWFVRSDECIETLGEKSRVAIRRRMVRELVDTASSVKSRGFDGYYIISHSLGTVVAINALMEPEITLPNYLTQEEWDRVPSEFKKQVSGAGVDHVPRRPLWLAEDAAISRTALLSNLKGLVTLGSPLDKFATLWPAVVPINDVPVSPRPVPWINVADAQDIVAGTIDQLGFKPESPGDPGLHLNNFVWGDQWTLFTAHTSYWKAVRGEPRLVNRLLGWIESGSFTNPEHKLNPALGKLIYWVTLVVLGLIPLAVIPGAAWIACRFGLAPGETQAMCPDGSFAGFVAAGMCLMFFIALAVCVSCAIIRRIWEEWRLAPK